MEGEELLFYKKCEVLNQLMDICGFTPEEIISFSTSIFIFTLHKFSFNQEDFEEMIKEMRKAYKEFKKKVPKNDE